VGPRAVLDAVVKRKFPTPAGNRTLELRLSARILVAIPTELSRFILFKLHKVRNYFPYGSAYFIEPYVCFADTSPLIFLQIYFPTHIALLNRKSAELTNEWCP
jgi:hypothetical protein